MTWRAEIVDGTVIRSQGSTDSTPLWLIHGFGESSRCFVPLFSMSQASRFQLLAPDWPGAGLTPPDPNVRSLDALAEWLARTIARRTPEGLIGIVAHSVGSIVAMRAASKLAGRIAGLVSIEGNLTGGDAYLSGVAETFDDPIRFRDALRRRMLAEAEHAWDEESYLSYYASLTFADPDLLWHIGREVKQQSDRFGEEYRALPFPTLYFWSRTSTSRTTQETLAANEIPNAEYSGGHWPMVEKPHETANVIDRFFYGVAERLST
ncbi:MAG TPA: alpha/beta hydrolase [Thermoanaerobaculia bacterium]|nr:alpha/beta hydrolase [Thermoanaerobaculia bacterium]